MRTKHNAIIWYPLVIAISIIAGIFIGNLISRHGSLVDRDHKINALLNLIAREYVDTVNTDDLVEMSIPKIIANLDPHSYYIPASDVQAVNDELGGSISGIGISFTMLSDTACVIEVIPGSPAEKVGILPGDRIISVNDSTITGKNISMDKVRSMITGEKGTDVKINIMRESSDDPLVYNITRGDIPVNSIDAPYMIAPKTGYLKVSKFGMNTYDEFLTALALLQGQGAEQYIIDLRGNSGGFMDQAILMANEFLLPEQLIVFTKGRDPRENTQVWSDNNGSFHDAQVVVLIDEYTASASEIMAGALQDNDRGLVVGRRSFGKGLVQKQTYFPDSSALRLTIARYFTPSGRCVQKDYKPGDDEDYNHEIIDRYSHGEAFSADSMKIDKSQIFYTANGRKVYGNGGIIPDIFVPEDTNGITSYYVSVANRGLLQKYAFRFCDRNRDRLEKADNLEKMLKALPSDDALSYDFIMYARENGVPVRWYYINPARSLIASQLKALIVRDLLGMTDFYKLLNRTDKTVLAALRALEEGKAVYPVTVEIQSQDAGQTEK